MAQFQEKIVKLADNYARSVYKITHGFPDFEKFALADQIRRAAISVVANIIEGFNRDGGSKELKRFINIAYASLAECKCLVYFAYKEKYIDTETYQDLSRKGDEISKPLWSLMRKLKDYN